MMECKEFENLTSEEMELVDGGFWGAAIILGGTALAFCMGIYNGYQGTK